MGKPLHSGHRSVSVHRLEVLGAALLFSTGGTVIKACSLSSWQVAGFRSGIAAAVLLLLLPQSRDWFRLPTLAVGAAHAATMVMFVAGNKLTTAANTIFLQSTAPMYLLLLGPWLLRERARPLDLVYTAAMGLGMALFFVGLETPQTTAPEPLKGNVVAACAGLTWALTVLGLRWLGRDSATAHTAEAAVVAGNMIACVVCLPLALPVRQLASLDVGILLYLGIFQVGLAYVCMTRGVRGLPALEVSLLLLLEPVLSTLWAWLVHSERPGPWALAGCSVIFASTLLRVLRGQRHLSPRSPITVSEPGSRVRD